MEFTGIKMLSYLIWNICIPSNRAYTVNTLEASCAYQKFYFIWIPPTLTAISTLPDVSSKQRDK